MQMFFKLTLIICLLLLNSGCSWLAILDTRTESPEIYQESLLQSKQRQIEFKKHVGWTENEIHSEWGRPKDIRYKEPYCITPGGDCNYSKERVGADIRFADEVWHYTRVFKSKTQHYIYSVSFYFVDGKVVKVESG